MIMFGHLDLHVGPGSTAVRLVLVHSSQLYGPFTCVRVLGTYIVSVVPAYDLVLRDSSLPI